MGITSVGFSTLGKLTNVEWRKNVKLYITQPPPLPPRWKAGYGTWNASCFEFNRAEEGKHRGRHADTKEYDDPSYQYFCLKTNTDRQPRVSRRRAQFMFLTTATPTARAIGDTQHPSDMHGLQYVTSAFCSTTRVFVAVLWSCWARKRRFNGRMKRYSSGPSFATKTVLLNLLCGVGNFVKIRSACGQHGIQYIKWSMNKYSIIMYVLLRVYFSTHQVL